MISYLVQGLLSNSTSLLTEGFDSNYNPVAIKVVFNLNKFNTTTSSSFVYLKLINTKLFNTVITNKTTKLNILNKNKLVKYKIVKYSYLNKINVK